MSLSELPGGEWLVQAPRVELFARWPPRVRASWWGRTFQGGPRADDRPVGRLSLDAEGLRLQRADFQEIGAVVWERPFRVGLSCWRYPDAPVAELNLRMRPVGGGAGVALRTVWPAERVGPQVEVKQEFSFFIPPQTFRRLWAWLEVCLPIHGERLPLGLDAQLEDAALEGMASRNEVMVCAACERQDVIMLAAGVYRCNLCGYEGGPGMAELARARRHRSFDRMSARQRQDSALEDVLAARRLLLSVEGSFRHMEAFARGNSQDDRFYKENEALVVARMTLEAREHLEDAAYKDPGRFEAMAWELEPRLRYAELQPEQIVSGGHLQSVILALGKLGEVLGEEVTSEPG